MRGHLRPLLAMVTACLSAGAMALACGAFGEESVARPDGAVDDGMTRNDGSNPADGPDAGADGQVADSGHDATTFCTSVTARLCADWDNDAGVQQGFSQISTADGGVARSNVHRVSAPAGVVLTSTGQESSAQLDLGFITFEEIVFEFQAKLVDPPELGPVVLLYATIDRQTDGGVSTVRLLASASSLVLQESGGGNASVTLPALPSDRFVPVLIRLAYPSFELTSDGTKKTFPSPAISTLATIRSMIGVYQQDSPGPERVEAAFDNFVVRVSP